MSNRSIIIALIVFFLIVLVSIFAAFRYYSAQEVPIQEQPQNFFDAIFPFDPTGSGDEPRRPSSNEPEETIDLRETEAPRLRQITDEAVAGAAILATSTDNEFSETIRYVLRGTGHIYDAEAESLFVERRSNATIPTVEHAIFNGDGSHAALQFRDQDTGSLQTFIATIPEEKETGQLDGDFLPNNIEHIALFSDEVGFVTRSLIGSSFIRSNLTGEEQTQVHTTPLRDILISWPTPDLISYTTKPSFGLPSYGTMVDVADGTERFFGPFTALTHTSSNPEQLLYTANDERGLPTLHIYSFERGAPWNFFTNTLSEKCAWSPINPNIAYCAVPIIFEPGSYPDDWYKGAVTFTDEIYRVDLENLTLRLVSFLEEEQGGEPIDATNLVVSPTESFLVFQNKKDLSLWSLRISLEELAEQEELLQPNLDTPESSFDEEGTIEEL